MVSLGHPSLPPASQILSFLVEVAFDREVWDRDRRNVVICKLRGWSVDIYPLASSSYETQPLAKFNCMADIFIHRDQISKVSGNCQRTSLNQRLSRPRVHLVSDMFFMQMRRYSIEQFNSHHV